jgi:four helix bundle protein
MYQGTPSKDNIKAMIQRFEDIQAWQESRKLVKMIYSLTYKELFSKDYGMRDQIRRASVSTMANIAEGFDCESRVEFARFLGIARRSAVEVQSILYAALDNGYINQEEFDLHYEQARKAKALIGGFKRSLTNKTSS